MAILYLIVFIFYLTYFKKEYIMDPVKVRNAIVEISDAMTRAQAERELIREIVKKIHDEEGLDKRVFRKMANVYYKGNFQDETALNEEFETTFTNVMS